MATTVTVYAAVTSLWLLGAITAYYVLRPLLFACAHCAILALWKSPRELLLDVKSQLRRRRLSDVLFYLVLGTVIASMVALNLPEPAARSRNVPPPGGGGGRQTGWDDASAAGGGANEKEYYDLLGLPPGASWDDIKRAYRALSLEWHPDKHPPHKHIYVKTVFMQITEAYEYFKDRQ